MIRRAYGSAVIAAALRGQRNVPYLPREEIERRRDRNARRIAAYAREHVPHYRDLPRIDGAADLERLPVLDRDEVRAHPERFVSGTRAARDTLAFTTSGATGTPLQVRHDRRSVLRNFAYGERERAPVIAITGAGFRPKELYVNYETSPMRHVTRFYVENTLMPVKPRRRFVAITTPVEEVAAIMRSERPDVLTGYGGWVDLFFRTVAARELEIPPPKLVIYMAEALPPGARELIEGTFGIPVLSRYSAAEAFKIGFTCEERRGFHLHEDLCHVRIDGDGRIVLSNLVNRAMVLLSYPIGDLGAISGEPCPCGRTFRLLSELEGRVEDMLTLTDGRHVHPRAIWGVFKDDPDVLQYQVVQVEPARFEVTLATLHERAFDRARTRAAPALHTLLGPGATIAITRRETLEERTGKFRAVAALPTARGTGADPPATTPPR